MTRDLYNQNIAIYNHHKLQQNQETPFLCKEKKLEEFPDYVLEIRPVKIYC